MRPPAPRGNGHNPLNVVDVNLKPNNAEHKQDLNIGLVNCQSIVNKKDEIADYNYMDIVAYGYSCTNRDLAHWHRDRPGCHW